MHYLIVSFIVCFLLFLPATAQTDNPDPTFLEPDTALLSPPKTLPDNSQTHEITGNERINQAAFLCTKAKELAKSQRFEEAKFLFEQACKLDPNNNSVIIHCNYARMLLNWGKIEEAIEEYTKALSFNSESEIAEIDIANCFMRLSKIEEAKFYLKKCIADHPDSPNINTTKAMLKGLRKVRIRSNKNGDDQSSPDYLENLSSFFKWTPMVMPIKVYIESGENIVGFKDSYTKMLIASLDAWTQASNGALTWQLVTKKGQGDITWAWTDDKRKLNYRSAEQGQSRIQQMMIGGRQFTTGASAILCIVNPLDNTPLEDNRIYNVCLHEVGHLLGISGHSPNSHDVMFYATLDSSPHELSARDIATIRLLYADQPILQKQNKNSK